MSGQFTFPYSSSPPSTPGSERRPQSSFVYGENPSTTPAGPPPSSAKIFTPAGIPPSTVFGSSQVGTAESLFSAKAREQQLPQPSAFADGGTKASLFPPIISHTTKVPLNDITRSSRNYGLVPHRMNQLTAYDAEGEEDPEVDVANGMQVDANDERNVSRTWQGDFGSSAFDWAAGITDIHDPYLEIAKTIEDNPLPTVVRDLARQAGPAELSESDALILRTDGQVTKMYDEKATRQEQERILAAALKVVPEALSKVWQTCCNEEKDQRGGQDDQYSDSIGPDESASNLEKATFVGTFLLRLYNPPVAQGSQTFKTSRNAFVGSLAPNISREEAYPKILVDWLAAHHGPYRSSFASLKSYKPNPTACNDFWDLVNSMTVRGQLSDVLQLFRSANFEYAATSKDDGLPNLGYHGSQLSNIQRVVNNTVLLLEACPVIKDSDWHVARDDWAMFRNRVQRIIDDLTTFAEGSLSADQRPLNQSTLRSGAFNFQASTNNDLLSQSARRERSKVPWTVYQSLKLFYSILLGNTEELLQLSQDWLEASLALTIWWDGNEEISTSSAPLRQSAKRERNRGTRAVDANAGAAYRRRLRHAYEKVVADSGLTVETHNPVQVALASVFTGSIDDVFALLRVWSLPITAAIMEVGTETGWYYSVRDGGSAVMAPEDAAATAKDAGATFDESDLMVLSYAAGEPAAVEQPVGPISKDNVLIDYAEKLFARTRVLRDGGQEVEGWEIALDLLARVDDSRFAKKRMREFVRGLPVESEDRAERLREVCWDCELEEEAREVAERFATYTAETSSAYGTALLYYAIAHSPKKVKDVLDLLISLCLMHSTAYPPLSTLDSHLRHFLLSPQESIAQLASEDVEAAEILSSQFAGYASMRRFYEIRDEGLSDGKEGIGVENMDIATRKRRAVEVLMTVVASSADNIQGGLYDKTDPAVVPVDGLLVLLGEASVFVDDPTILSLPQHLLLLRAIEDLSTVHPSIRRTCTDCFSSSLASFHGAPSPESRELMKKSISDLTASTGFSLVGSEMMVRSESSGRGGEGEMDERRAGDERARRWDWRDAMRRGESVGALIRRLRLGIARGVAGRWVSGEEG